MVVDDLKWFDRNLEDFREDVARARNLVQKAVPRYVAMMDAIETAFLLYYDGLSTADKTTMLRALTKLIENTRSTLAPESNVIPISKKGEER